MATSSISGVGSISSAGIGSGLDVNSIVTQLMAVESQPLRMLQNQASSLQTQVSTYGNMKSLYATLGDKVHALLSPTLWSATTATSDDPASVKVATASSAQSGSYAVSVDWLAGSQTVTSTAVASSATTLSQGTLKIELGTWKGTLPSDFESKSGGSPVTVTIGPGQTSLAGIRDQINAAGAGVTASIITDASGARLSLRSTATGAENGFRITASPTGTTDPITDPTGTDLSLLAYRPPVGASAMSLSQSAIDASVEINGITVKSASNTLSNVVDGLTISLLKPTSSAVGVSVAADTASISTAIKDFVTAFNGIAGFIHTQTAYNAGSKTGGALQGDQATLSMQNQLRGVINQPSSASSVFSTLSDIGIAMKADGTLAVDSTKLNNALGNLPELKKVLYTTGADGASSGFMRRFQTITDAVTSIGGAIESRTTGLSASLKRNSKSQDDLQTRLVATEARLRAQYTSLDATMGKLNGLSSYISQQITTMNKSTS